MLSLALALYNRTNIERCLWRYSDNKLYFKSVTWTFLSAILSFLCYFKILFFFVKPIPLFFILNVHRKVKKLDCEENLNFAIKTTNENWEKVGKKIKWLKPMNTVCVHLFRSQFRFFISFPLCNHFSLMCLSAVTCAEYTHVYLCRVNRKQ